jgi:hypothetical protein
MDSNNDNDNEKDLQNIINELNDIKQFDTFNRSINFI